MSLFFLFVSTHVRYQFDCFPLSFVHNLGINLRGAYAGMPQKFGNGVEVCPQREHHGGMCVASRTEGDVLVYTGLSGPKMKDVIGSSQRNKSLEYQLLTVRKSPFGQLFQSLKT